ncbi:MAG: SUMF1/EgtB/PvdO family nonheme iron enzyme, partial [Actinobacteria bacterium]|nr:SUMF1/EgtB/PvdO family nonheme iron enzyme [Actinomycetota bacterium]
AGMASADIRADLSGNAVVDFTSTMDMPFMIVGNPGNTGELSGESVPDGFGPDRICGAVDYKYNIGKYEVTAGQYTEFLNATAATDTYGLYNTSMADTTAWTFGCNIQQHGSLGNYTYSVSDDWANRPVNYVGPGDAARFANWLHNGQPTGVQNDSTTEDGSYYLNGAMSDAELQAISRKANATWAITSEDEWYKAAYHKNDGVTGNYFDYPTSSDSRPSNDLVDPDLGNNATFHAGGYSIGSPYWRTEVGAHENSDSPYGTFDQGGNVWEWNEAIIGSWRGVRGGSLEFGDADSMHALFRNYTWPTLEYAFFGFRVSEVPEPATLSMLALGGLAMLRRRRSC